ncbi:MAG: dUTP diphosphatase [Lachnospiraceae bacterium]|nr:dUTP diphosphatase [Lachnospiraceae bacterium]
MQIRVIKLPDTARMPARGRAGAAGFDLFADMAEEKVIAPHETAMISTGLIMAITPGYFGAIFARSGLASRKGLRPANCVGVVDSDYRGEVLVALHNDSLSERTVSPGERIAQLVLLPYPEAEFVEAESLDETERGAGGFGSTGR